MIWIDTSRREPIQVFQETLHHYLRSHNKRHSDRRVQVLQTLYALSVPVTVDTLAKRVSERYDDIGYATVARNIHFFKSIGWLLSNKNRYILKTDAQIVNDTE